VDIDSRLGEPWRELTVAALALTAQLQQERPAK